MSEVTREPLSAPSLAAIVSIRLERVNRRTAITVATKPVLFISVNIEKFIQIDDRVAEITYGRAIRLFTLTMRISFRLRFQKRQRPFGLFRAWLAAERD